MTSVDAGLPPQAGNTYEMLRLEEQERRPPSQTQKLASMPVLSTAPSDSADLESSLEEKERDREDDVLTDLKPVSRRPTARTNSASRDTDDEHESIALDPGTSEMHVSMSAKEDSVIRPRRTTNDSHGELDDEEEEEWGDHSKRKADEANTPPSRQPSFDDLFFDLLFAACLSVYTNNASLTSAASIAVFIGYFALLWWSWWSQTLFDVRYRGRDRVDFITQIIQRVLRCALLGVWVAFSTVASEFARSSYSNFTMIYVGSRAILATDYLLIIARSFIVPLQMRDHHIPGATKGHGKARFSVLTSHLIMIAGLFISIAFWVGSWYVRSDQTLPPSVIGFWIAGIVVEMLSEWIVELNFALRSLSATPIVERLALFSLIIFGNGFENIGSVLNVISPGSRDWSRNGIPFGGWGSITIINAGASVVIVILLFFGYFSRAIKTFYGHPTRFLLWSYFHLVLHVSSAVLMVGLGKVIGFANTLNALSRFIEQPDLYLPNTTEWRDFINNGFIAQLDEDGELPDVYDLTNYYARSTASVIVSLFALQGAEIPNVDLANALVNSTVPFDGVPLTTTVRTTLQAYSGLVDDVQSPDGLSKFVDANVYSFYYAYLCPAIFLIADVVLKVIQHYDGRGNPFKAMQRSLVVSLVIRFAFGILLIIVQIIYYVTLDSNVSDNPLLLGLVVLACILFAESALQTAWLHARSFVRLWRRRGQLYRYMRPRRP